MDQRACLAPYFVSYAGGNATQLVGIDQITADFMEWEGGQSDLVLCNQVLEHVPDPSEFLKKLITTSTQATIISVPYQWPVCSGTCGHLHHEIDLERVLQWAAPYKPVYQRIVTETKMGPKSQRLFMVFEH